VIATVFLVAYIETVVDTRVFHPDFLILYGELHRPPVTVAEQSKACTVFARSEAGIVVSNPTQGMDV
jgi:hypothetical protein